MSFSSAVAMDLTSTLFETLTSVFEENSSEESSSAAVNNTIEQSFSPPVTSLCKRYPAIWDKVVDLQESSPQVDRIVQLISGINDSLFISVSHAKAQVRAQAVDKLAELIASNKDLDVLEKVQIVSVLSSRWQDSNPLVLLRLLARFEIFLSEPNLMHQLIDIVEGKKQATYDGHKLWRKVQLKAMETVLCETFANSLSDVKCTELAHYCLLKLFRLDTGRKFQRKLALTVLNSHFLTKHFGKNCFEGLKSMPDASSNDPLLFTSRLMAALSVWHEGLPLDNKREYSDFYQKSTNSKEYHQIRQLTALMLMWSLDDPKISSIQKFVNISEFLEIYPKTLNESISMRLNSEMPDLDTFVTENCHENTRLIEHVRSIIETAEDNDQTLLTASWELQISLIWRMSQSVWPLLTPAKHRFEAKDSRLAMLVNNELACHAMEVLTAGISQDPKRTTPILLNFVQDFLTSPKTINTSICLLLIKLASRPSCGGECVTTRALQTMLKILCSCLRSSPVVSLKNFDQDLPNVYPILLICMGYGNEYIRKAAGKVWSVLFQQIPESSANRTLVVFVNSRIKEIEDDSNHIKEVLSQLYNAKIRAAASKSALLAIWTEVVAGDTPASISIMLAGVMSSICDQAVITKSLARIDDLMNQIDTQSNETEASVDGSLTRTLLQTLVQKFAAPACTVLKSDKKALETFMNYLNLTMITSADVSAEDTTGGLLMIDLNFCQIVGPEIVTKIFQKLFSQKVESKLQLSSGDMKSSGSGSEQLLIMMPIASDCLSGWVDELKSAVEPCAVSPGKRKKTISQSSSQGGVSSVGEDSPPVQKPSESVRRTHASLLLYVELMEHGSNQLFSSRLQLVPVLFRLVKLILDMKGVVSFYQLDMGYLLNLALSVLTRLCSTETAKTHLHQKDFMVDTLVRVVRECDSQRTHQLALELLTHAAGILREHVIHHIMSIFTFMGSSLFRQDDEYSCSVIHRTIATVIPAVVESAAKGQHTRSREHTSLAKTIGDIFQIFVTARRDIAAHRKMTLFKLLVEATSVSEQKVLRKTAGDESNQSTAISKSRDAILLDENVQSLSAKDCLWIMIGQLMKHGVESICEKANSGIIAFSNKTRKSQMEEYLEFSVQLAQQFSPTEQIQCCSRLMGLFQSLPPSLEISSTVKLPFGTASDQAEFESVFHRSKFANDVSLCGVRQGLFRFCRYLLGSSEFLASVASMNQTDYGRFVNSCESLVEHLLRGAAACNFVVESYEEKQPKLVTIFEGYLADIRGILDQLNSLLPAATCLSIVHGLLSNDDPVLNRFGMELMDTKLQQNPTPFTQDNVEELSQICALLTGNIQSHYSADGSDVARGEEHQVALQMSLFTIKLLTKVIGPFQPICLKEAFAVVVQFVHGWRTVPKPVLMGNGVLALSELATTLGMAAVPVVNTFVPDVLDIVEHTIRDPDLKGDKEAELVFASCLFALERMFTPFVGFLSPYFARMLHLTSNSVKLVSDSRKTRVTGRMSSLTERISGLTPRVLLPIMLEVVQERLKAKQLEGLEYLFKLLIRHLAKQDVDSLTASDIGPLFCELFDIRRYNYFSWEESAHFDSLSAEAFVSLSLKLPESKFRPILNQMSEWAAQSALVEHRYLSLFAALQLLSDKLMSLFLIFAGPLLVVCAKLLPRLTEVDKKSKSTISKQLYDQETLGDATRARRHLLCQVLAVLANSFKHSGNTFMNSERVEMLSPHLVGLIDGHRIQNFDQFITVNLRSCLVGFGLAITDQTLLKTLNHEILLKTRSSLPKVRLAALKILGELYSRLGDGLSRLIPETIPFVAELIEDENEDVESECRAVMNVIESVSGESLENYL